VHQIGLVPHSAGAAYAGGSAGRSRTGRTKNCEEDGYRRAEVVPAHSF